jgi:ComF family protein
MVRSLLNAVLDIVYPLECGACKAAAGSVLCSDCLRSIAVIDESAVCAVCGRPMSHRMICGGCLSAGRAFSEGHYGFSYEGALREAIHAFKFQGRKDVGRYLVRLLEARLKGLQERIDCIVAVAVTERRLKERGFNQSFVIAHEIGRITGRPVLPSVLRKVKENEDQFKLPKERRAKNVRGVFAAGKTDAVSGKRVLLVDDLFTTGSTAHEAARALCTVGAAEVLLFTLARTP